MRSPGPSVLTHQPTRCAGSALGAGLERFRGTGGRARERGPPGTLEQRWALTWKRWDRPGVDVISCPPWQALHGPSCLEGPQPGVSTRVESQHLKIKPGAGVGSENPPPCLPPAERGTDHAGGHLGDPLRAGQCHLLLQAAGRELCGQ